MQSEALYLELGDNNLEVGRVGNQGQRIFEISNNRLLKSNKKLKISIHETLF